ENMRIENNRMTKSSTTVVYEGKLDCRIQLTYTNGASSAIYYQNTQTYTHSTSKIKQNKTRQTVNTFISQSVTNLHTVAM
ncbi:conserved hypothetical protein, partial [Trichinella spiralis]|uniref:hypothetical protein n=1 Tax=Trichinella spiralis TaxID=6334 RepID=UPI0001EFDE43